MTVAPCPLRPTGYREQLGCREQGAALTLLWSRHSRPILGLKSPQEEEYLEGGREGEHRDIGGQGQGMRWFGNGFGALLWGKALEVPDRCRSRLRYEVLSEFDVSVLETVVERGVPTLIAIGTATSSRVSSK